MKSAVGAFQRETDEQKLGTELLERIGCFVFRTNQPRASRVTPGLPDVIALLPRRLGVLLWEAKSATGRQSDAQILVESRCRDSAVPYVCGTVADLTVALEGLGLVG